MTKHYYDMHYHCIVTEEEIRFDFTKQNKVHDFEEFLEDLTWCNDVIPLEEQDLVKLKSEKCYFCEESHEVLSESEMRKGFYEFCYSDEWESFEDWIGYVTAPWEPVRDMHNRDYK